MPEKNWRRFSMKRLFLIVLLPAVALGVYRWLFAPVTIRPATASDPIRERYFGFEAEKVTIRNIAIAEGTFSHSTWLSTAFYLVEAGKVTQLSASTVGRTPHDLGSLPWTRMKITLAIGERVTPQGTISQLGAAGHRRGGGTGGGEFTHHVSALHSQVLAGPIASGAERVVYAEGDIPISLDRHMNLERFLKKNRGNYLVVTAQMK